MAPINISSNLAWPPAASRVGVSISQGIQRTILGSLLLITLLIPLYFSLLFHDYNLPKLVMLEIFTVLMTVLWISGMALRGEISVLRTSLYITFLAFLGINLISLLQAINRLQGLERVFQYLCYFLIPVVVFHTVREARHLRLLSGTMALTGGIVALILDPENWTTA